MGSPNGIEIKHDILVSWEDLNIKVIIIGNIKKVYLYQELKEKVRQSRLTKKIGERRCRSSRCWIPFILSLSVQTEDPFGLHTDLLSA